MQGPESCGSHYNYRCRSASTPCNLPYRNRRNPDDRSAPDIETSSPVYTFHLTLKYFFQVFADSRNLHSKQFSHRLLCNPQAFIHNQSSPSLMLEKSNPSDSRPVVLAPRPSANAGDHHSILSISIFTCHLFPSLSICRTQNQRSPARGSAHPIFFTSLLLSEMM